MNEKCLFRCFSSCSNNQNVIKIRSIFAWGFNPEACNNDCDDVLVDPVFCVGLPDWTGPGAIGEIVSPPSGGVYPLGTECNYVCPSGKFKKASVSPNFIELLFLLAALHVLCR